MSKTLCTILKLFLAFLALTVNPPPNHTVDGIRVDSSHPEIDYKVPHALIEMGVPITLLAHTLVHHRLLL